MTEPEPPTPYLPTRAPGPAPQALQAPQAPQAPIQGVQPPPGAAAPQPTPAFNPPTPAFNPQPLPIYMPPPAEPATAMPGTVVAPGAPVPPGVAVAPGTAAAPGTAVGAQQPGVLAPAELATVAGAAAVALARAASAIAAPGAPPGAPPAPTGTVYSASLQPGKGRRGSRWLRMLPRLQIGTHVASAPALRELRPAGSTTGLVLGFDADQKVSSVRMFQPEPTRMALVGGLWAARIVVFRALAVGAIVTVLTGRPEVWTGMGEWATGRNDRVLLRPLNHRFAADSTALTPTLVVYDGSTLDGTASGNLGPWQAHLSLVPQVTAYAFPSIRDASLVITQRLTPEEAIAMTPLLGLTREASTLVQALQDDMFALFDSAPARYIWAQPTSIERRQFGTPGRFEPALIRR